MPLLRYMPYSGRYLGHMILEAANSSLIVRERLPPSDASSGDVGNNAHGSGYDTGWLNR